MVSLGADNFEKLMAIDSNELRLCFKLRSDHLKCEGIKRQRVRLATQLLSHTVAKAFLYLFDGIEAKTQHDAILLFNDFFDVCNSRRMNDKAAPLRSGFGINLAHQLYVCSGIFSH